MSARFDQLNSSNSTSDPQKNLNREDMETPRTKESLNDNPSSATSSRPSRFIRKSESESGDRTSRKLWWSPPQRNQIEIRNEIVKYRDVQPRVGSLANIEYRPGGGQVAIQDKPVQWQASSKVNSLSNANWSPTIPRRVSVRREKLNWNAQPKVNSLENVTYKPGGGSVEIPEQKLDFKHVSPRVNCGFIN